ncbi:MAG: 30S ribosome-binding factor RbfA [Acidimicrobiales bacterium]
MAKRRRNSPRDYPRTARLNELLREVLASEIDQIDDPRLGWISVSGIEVDAELTKARVYLSFLDDAESGESIEVLEESRGALKQAIGNQTRLRKVPDLEFIVDPAITGGGRVEEILSDLRNSGEIE